MMVPILVQSRQSDVPAAFPAQRIEEALLVFKPDALMFGVAGPVLHPVHCSVACDIFSQRNPTIWMQWQCPPAVPAVVEP